MGQCVPKVPYISPQSAPLNRTCFIHKHTRAYIFHNSPQPCCLATRAEPCHNLISRKSGNNMHAKRETLALRGPQWCIGSHFRRWTRNYTLKKTPFRKEGTQCWDRGKSSLTIASLPRTLPTQQIKQSTPPAGLWCCF